ncbi:MAG: T9SS type A sorting domain-containing protein [Crocinitomicaceae bacterium]|nr:T9SS type A sorting domain-containing protein [Crocinitomicaceae bacterium]
MRFIIIPVALCMMLSCDRQGAGNFVEQNSESSGGMSYGNDSSLQSRVIYEYQRLRNPQTGVIPADIRKRELEFVQSLPVNMTKAFTWQLRGPINKGGRTRAVALDIQDENIWFAAGVTGGIWRSTNAGTSWTKVTSPLQMHSITSIVQDTRPGHEDTWYAGTGEQYGIVSASTFEARFSGDGMLKSTDGGLTWVELTSTQSSTPETFLANHEMDFVWRIVVDHTDLANDVVLAAVYNGVFRSDDGGATWTEVLGFQQGSFSNLHSDYVELIITPSGVFYATLSSDSPSKGIFRSDDGITWTSIIPPSFPTGYGRLAMAVNPQDDNEIWFFGSTNGSYANGHSLFKYNYLSGDGSGAGGTWEDRSMNLPHQSCFINGISFELGYLNTQSSFDVHMAIHPDDPDVIYIAGTSIWRSTDGFSTDTNNTWIGGYQCDDLPYDDINWQLSYPDHHPDQHYMIFLPSDHKVMINVNDGGIYKTVDNLDDSVKWIPLNNGFVTTQFYAVAMEPGETTSDIIIGGMQDNGTWFTNTNEFDSAWVEVGGGDGMYCAITENAEFYVICTQNGKMFLKEIDGDGNVLGHERIDPEDGPSSYNWCNSLKLDPNNTNTLYWNGRTKLFRLDDLHDITISGDKTNKEPNFWVEIAESNVLPGGGIITDIEMSKAGANQVWYGTSQGDLYRLDEANSATPVQVDLTVDYFPAGSWVSSISVDPFDANKILVTFANYEIPSIFYSKDGGLTWDDISGNLEENIDGSGAGPAALWCERYPDGTLFVGTTSGLYVTTMPDSANTIWTLEAGIGNVVINHMDYRTHDGRMIVGTHGNGVYSTGLNPAFAGMESVTSPQDILLYPTFTNQYIHVSAQNGQRIEIYDLTGKKCLDAVITNNYTLQDVSSFSNGIYIAVITTSSQKKAVKFVKG